MRNYKFYTFQVLIPLIVSTIIIVSCSSEEHSNEGNVKINNKELLNELTYFNNNFIYSYSNQNDDQARKWWQTVLQVAAVATGDAAGAAAGVWAAQGLAGVVGLATAGTGYAVVSAAAGVVGAVGGSYTAYCGTGGQCRASINLNNPKGENIKYDFPSEFNYLESFGSLHNDLILNVYLSNNSTEMSWLENNIDDINKIDFGLLYNNSEFQILIHNINTINSNYKINDYDTAYLLNQYQNKGLINDNIKSVLELYFAASMKAKVFSDYESVTSFYVQSIKNTTLTNREKEALYSAFSVAIQSYYLWLNIEEE